MYCRPSLPGPLISRQRAESASHALDPAHATAAAPAARATLELSGSWLALKMDVSPRALGERPFEPRLIRSVQKPSQCHTEPAGTPAWRGIDQLLFSRTGKRKKAVSVCAFGDSEVAPHAIEERSERLPPARFVDPDAALRDLTPADRTAFQSSGRSEPAAHWRTAVAPWCSRSAT